MRGVRWGAGTPPTLRNRCLALMTRLPRGAFFCGPTAALIQGMPLPGNVERSPVLHVGVLAPSRALRIAGVRSRSFTPLRFATLDWLGLPVTEPARTWRDLAPQLALPDLVAVGDFLIHGSPALATRDDLARQFGPGERGAVALRAALPLLDGRSESRPESLLRLILHSAGIRGYVPNHWVTLSRPRVRYRIDLAFPEYMLGLEYQSGYHHDPEQWKADMTRLSRLRAHGWDMHEVSQADVDSPSELANRIRMLLERSAK